MRRPAERRFRSQDIRNEYLLIRVFARIRGNLGRLQGLGSVRVCRLVPVSPWMRHLDAAE